MLRVASYEIALMGSLYCVKKLTPTEVKKGSGKLDVDDFIFVCLYLFLREGKGVFLYILLCFCIVDAILFGVLVIHSI